MGELTLLDEDRIDVGEAEATTEIDLDVTEQSLEEEVQVEEVIEDDSQPTSDVAESVSSLLLRKANLMNIQKASKKE